MATDRVNSAISSEESFGFALLTSLEKDHADLKHLPINTGFIRRGPEFGDDLAMVLERFQIT